MEKALGLCKYTDRIYGGEHAIDWETVQNLSFMDAFLEIELPSLKGWCVCPLSKKAREWSGGGEIVSPVRCRRGKLQYQI
jgi:hypothetical protein